MGKNQHSKDRLFITATEWKRDYGGKNSAAQSRARPVPFDCCGLSFLPFVDPVCTPDGAVFDIVNIVRYIQKHHKHPNTGARLEVGSLTKLHYHKNAEGKYHCPITFKVFGDHTHIVAIRTSGNVYSYDAVKELNIKARNWTDLLTSQSFDRKTDVITLQDPNNRRIVSVVVDQSWVKGSLKVERAEKKKEKKASKEAVLARAKKAAEAVARSDLMNPENEKRIRFTTNRVAGAFTSTGVEVASTSEERPLSQEEKDAARWKAIKKLKRKGYVSLRTNLGDINLEVDCDIVPQTAENFLGLAAKGYYDGTIFHRNIRNFMLQGGDPTGTGKGGESLWGGKFKDEFTNQVSHNGRGILSMANAGKNTNGSQFFITYKSCQHLDNKHAIFGRVVGGTDVLRALELVPTDESDRPKKEIKILKAVVFENPVKDYDEGVTEAAASSLAAQKAARKRKAAGGGGGGADDAPEPALKTEQIVVKVDGEWVVKTQVVPTAKALEDGVVPTPAAARGVGRYLKLPADAAAEKKTKKKQKKKEAAAAAAAAVAAAAARPAEAAPSHYKPKFKKTRTQFGNFSGW